MDSIHRQVAVAKRRLILEQFCSRTVYTLSRSFALALVAIALPKLVHIPGLAKSLPLGWDTAWLVGAIVASPLVAGIWTYISHRSNIDAAIEIDHRFSLRERVASGLYLSDSNSQTDAGRAVLCDAQRVAERIDVASKFPLRFGNRPWLPILPGALALLLALLVSDREATSSTDIAQQQAITKQVEQSAEALRKKIAKRREEAKEKGLDEAEGILKELEEKTLEIAKEKGKKGRSQAVVKLNDLVNELKQRKDQLGDREAIKRQLQNMKNITPGPANKLAEAMKKADWQEALKQAQELQKKMSAGKLSESDQKQLSKQLESMAKSIESLAETRKQAMQEIQDQIKQMKEQGNQAGAEQLQKKLDKIANQQKRMDQLNKLAQKMNQAQKSLQKGEGKQASQQMQQMTQQLAQMAEEMEELEMMEMALDQVQLAKNSMTCKQCAGMGCQSCQGDMFSQFPARGDQGNGMGQGTGQGDRPDEENRTNLRDTRVKLNPGRGASVFAGLIDGPNRKGRVTEQIKQEVAELTSGPADPLSAENLSKSQKEQAQQFFRRFREGE